MWVCAQPHSCTALLGLRLEAEPRSRPQGIACADSVMLHPSGWLKALNALTSVLQPELAVYEQGLGEPRLESRPGVLLSCWYWQTWRQCWSPWVVAERCLWFVALTAACSSLLQGFQGSRRPAAAFSAQCVTCED